MGVEMLVGEHMARNLDKWLSKNLPYVDHIFLHRPHVAEEFLSRLKKQVSFPPISFVGHDLYYLRTRREYEVNGDEAVLKQSGNWLEREKAVIETVDHTLYFSQVEVDAVAELVPSADVRAIPLDILEPIELERIQTPILEILFVPGFNHPPNIDGTIWFVSQILPPIRDQVGDVQFHIAVSNQASRFSTWRVMVSLCMGMYPMSAGESFMLALLAP